MQREWSGVEDVIQDRLAKVCKDTDKAQLIASIARESVEDVGASTRTSWHDALDEALLDLEVSLSAKQLSEILDELEEDGILNSSSEEEAEHEYSSNNLVGKPVLAMMKIFDSSLRTDVKEWESGVIKEVEGGDEFGLGATIHVFFDRFAATQVVNREDICFDFFDEDDEELHNGVCPFCERTMPLTFHHLIPRCTHKAMKKKHGLDTKTLNQGVDLCRPCHSTVHRTESNVSLAENYNTPAKLLAHPSIQKWIAYAKKQKCEGNGQDGLRLRK